MPARKRFLTAVGLGVVFGLVCVMVASQHQPEIANLNHPLFWAIFTDRVLIGLMIAFAGAFTRHPLFGFRLFPWMRGTLAGMAVSLPLAAGAMSCPGVPDMSLWTVFGLTLLSGAVYGIIIDVVATRVGGEGPALVQP